MIERLRRQRLRLLRAGGLGFGDVEAIGVLDQRVEPAPMCPRSCMAIGAERDIDNAGPDARCFLRAKTVAGDGAGPVALHENVGVL